MSIIFSETQGHCRVHTGLTQVDEQLEPVSFQQQGPKPNEYGPLAHQGKYANNVKTIHASRNHIVCKKFNILLLKKPSLVRDEKMLEVG